MGKKQVGLLLTAVMLVMAFERVDCNTQDLGKVVYIKSNANTRVERSESVLHHDSRSLHRSRRAVTNEMETQEALDNHNRVRRLEGASDIEIMTWNIDLAAMASGWADNCTFEHGQPYAIPSSLPYTSLGQNLYAISGVPALNISAAIQAWYDEKEFFNYTTLGCKLEEQCGHYTQVVWATSRLLGCAYKKCNSLKNSTVTLQDAFYLVCNYGPPGNVVGEKPFKKGPGCSACESGSWWCNSGLCDRSCTTASGLASTTCGCAPVCLNFGSVVNSSCSCSCTPGWLGSNCGEVCENKDPQCDPKPGYSGYPPAYCDRSDYGPTIRKLCPKMCKVCQATVGSNGHYTSTKPSLLTAMLSWLSWLLINSFRSI